MLNGSRSIIRTGTNEDVSQMIPGGYQPALIRPPNHNSSGGLQHAYYSSNASSGVPLVHIRKAGNFDESQVFPGNFTGDVAPGSNNSSPANSYGSSCVTDDQAYHSNRSSEPDGVSRAGSQSVHGGNRTNHIPSPQITFGQLFQETSNLVDHKKPENAVGSRSPEFGTGGHDVRAEAVPRPSYGQGSPMIRTPEWVPDSMRMQTSASFNMRVRGGGIPKRIGEAEEAILEGREIAGDRCIDLQSIVCSRIEDTSSPAFSNNSGSAVYNLNINMNTSLNGNGYYCPSPTSNSMAGGGSRLRLSSESERSCGASSLRSMRSSFEESSECRRFTCEQLAHATGNWNQSNLLGRGSFGQVFKGRLAGCHVAIKKLEGGGWQGPEEYKMEVEVLSRMRHPHIVLLMGHCPEDMSLVYEYLPGGTLQDCLNFRQKGGRPLTWQDRIRILSEVTSALIYLHQHDPPIAHRDLKPENILLDRTRSTSKLGDAGLARLVAEEEENTTSRIRGTTGYIDPEEVLTCEISVLSDVYALGLIVLQLLMGEPNVKNIHAILRQVYGGGKAGMFTRAVDSVIERLDHSGGRWSSDAARKLAVIALRCADRERSRRPDLAEEVEPAFAKLALEAAIDARERKSNADAQLLCPLSMVEMVDPVVAADGFTYERQNIEKWLIVNDTSPCTGQALLHKALTPNLALKNVINMQSANF